MTTEEKLSNFHDIVMEEANKQGDVLIKEHDKRLTTLYEKEKETYTKRSQLALRAARDRLNREKNKKIFEASLDARRLVGNHTAELKNKLFEQVEKRLFEYKKTPEYTSCLIKLIEQIKTFSKENETIFYLDPSDAALKEILEKETQITLTISDRSFMGGIRGVIPLKSILIDHSFSSKLAEQKENYKL